MSNRRYYRVAAIAAIVVLLALPATSQRSDDSHQFTGTWLHKDAGMDLPALVTFHSDGTVTISSGYMFGVGNPFRLSPIHGVWERTGPNSVTVMSLFMTFDANGMMTGYQRNHCPVTFSRDGNTYTGVEFMETVSCTNTGCPDPLDPKTVWTPVAGLPATGVPISAGRLRVSQWFNR